MCFAPANEIGVAADAVPQDGHVVFDACDFFRIGRFPLEPQDRLARFIGQGRRNASGHLFEVAVVAGAFLDMDHIQLPEFAFLVFVPSVPFEAPLYRRQQVAVFDSFDGRIGGKLR